MFKQLNSILAATTSLLSAATAAASSDPGNARVINNCPYEVTLWSVGSTVAAPYTLAPHGGQYAEPFTRDPQTGGRSLKMTRGRDSLLQGKPQTVFAYTLDPNRVFFDLSDIFGDAFAGCRVQVVPANPDCPAIVWPDGRSPGGSQVRNCFRDSDVTATLCAHDGRRGGFGY